MNHSSRRRELSGMRETLVQARVALEDMSAALEKTRDRIGAEQRELDTIRRRKGMAEKIGDNETVSIATSYEEKHGQRLEVLLRKLAAQEEELALAQAEVGKMTAEFKAAASGVGAAPDVSAAAAREAEEVLNEAEALRSEIDGLARRNAREAREAAAEERLAELKRRMQQ